MVILRHLFVFIMLNLSSIVCGKRRVAVCGSGISACVAANKLQGTSLFDVTIYEVGRGAGGRTSSRRQDNYVFDHGAVSIAASYTQKFKELVQEWEAEGIVKGWSPREISLTGTTLETKPTIRHLVGVPSMNSICKHLLSSASVNTVFQHQAAVKRLADSWTIGTLASAAAIDPADSAPFDYIISADRNSMREDRKDFSFPATAAALAPFARIVQQHLSSQPVLIAMLVLSRPLPADIGDILTFKDHPVLTQIIRDSSKPERERQDGRECWVLHSTSDHARRIIR